jgi:hypothetical protein
MGNIRSLGTRRILGAKLEACHLECRDSIRKPRSNNHRGISFCRVFRPQLFAFCVGCGRHRGSLGHSWQQFYLIAQALRIAWTLFTALSTCTMLLGPLPWTFSTRPLPSDHRLPIHCNHTSLPALDFFCIQYLFSLRVLRLHVSFAVDLLDHRLQHAPSGRTYSTLGFESPLLSSLPPACLPACFFFNCHSGYNDPWTTGFTLRTLRTSRLWLVCTYRYNPLEPV